jgi:hypothetical protein
MATYRVLNPEGDVVDTKDFDTASRAEDWFQQIRDNSELGWRIEVRHDAGDWHFFGDSEGRSK